MLIRFDSVYQAHKKNFVEARAKRLLASPLVILYISVIAVARRYTNVAPEGKAINCCCCIHIVKKAVT